MDLPVFRRGLELVSSQLNKLSQGIRAATITSVIGGSFTRTPGGTTLVIGQQPGGGGGGNAAYCSFKCSDASDNGDLFIKIQQDQVNGQYPMGMDGTGDYTVQIGDDLINNPWIGVYLIIEVTEFGVIREPVSMGTMRVQLSQRPFTGSSMVQAYLLAEVTLSTGPDGRYISNIANACPLVEVAANGLCPFEVGDLFGVEGPGQNPQIQIKTGLIEARYPKGMSLNSLTTLTIPSDGEWHAVYCQLTVDSNGNIVPGEDAIKFILSNEYKTDTSSIQYVLISEVTTCYLGDGSRYICYIQNYCLVPAPVRASTSTCKFQITNASTELLTQILISPAPVQTGTGERFPSGMGPDSGQFFLQIPQTGYILMAVVWDLETYNVATGSNSITIFFSSTAMENTSSIQYIILGTVLIANNVITGTYSVCSDPKLTPCELQV